MLVFSLTAGAIWVFVATRWGRWPAAAASGAWVLQPNLFANGHYATLDAILSSLWVLGLIAFAQAVRPANPRNARFPSWVWVVAFGILAGWAADTKLTGWFLPVPMLAWTIVARDRRGLITLLVAGVVAIVTLCAFNPAWWGAPIDGVLRFLVSNLSRGKTVPIAVLFLGSVVQTPNESLPWYNTLVWTVFVTPVGFLLLAIGGVVWALARRRDEPIAVLVAINWAFLLALRALPHTPGHDGVRQFLPAFGVLALASGLGVVPLLRRFGRWAKAAVVAALAEAAIGLAVMMPVPLSYFSPIVGGLPGAARLGMEPTYFWDALSPKALKWLNDKTPRGEKVLFATNPTSWFYLQAHGKLRAEILPYAPGRRAWYVVQNRPGEFRPLDRALVAKAKPANVIEEKFGVPLVWVFPYDEVERTLAGAPPQ
jgi:hypothetical protein